MATSFFMGNSISNNVKEFLIQKYLNKDTSSVLDSKEQAITDKQEEIVPETNVVQEVPQTKIQEPQNTESTKIVEENYFIFG